jgi:hypothetical protein
MYKNLPKVNWAFFYFGDDFPRQRCVEGEPFVPQFTCIPSASFDKESLRFEIINHGSYIDQGFWERERREHPKAPLPVDPTHPDDLGIEIGRCSPNTGAPPLVVPPPGASPVANSTENATEVCARRCLPSGCLPNPPGIGTYISELPPSTEACLHYYRALMAASFRVSAMAVPTPHARLARLLAALDRLFRLADHCSRARG